MPALLAKTLRSSTFRLALISIAVFGAAVLALFAFVYLSTSAFILSQSDAGIDADMAALRRAYGAGGRDNLVRVIENRLVETDRSAELYLLADASFVPLVGNLKNWPPLLKGPEGSASVNLNLIDSGKVDRNELFRLKWEALPTGLHLLIGKSIAALGRFEYNIDIAFVATILFILILAAAASVTVTRRTVGRIETINATTREIMGSGLGKRISLRGTRDEWDNLAQNLNSMLDRIETLMIEVKQVGDNIAHDLRTPLTRMRGRLEKASLVGRNSEHDQALLDQTICDLDTVLSMFSSLTRIAQIETSPLAAGFRTVDLGKIATEVVELFDAAAEVKGVEIKLLSDRPTLIAGDRELLFDALSNLVDNAIKHGQENGQVTVGVASDDTGILMTVSDDGPGIPSNEIENVFKRFYRLEQSRSTPGNGLGLSLVSAVARLHGAYIALVDNKPGVRVEVRFPALRK